MDTEPRSLADALTGYVTDELTALVSDHFPGFRLPTVFAGHPVGQDVRADLVFTLGMLHEGGVEAVADVPVVDAIARVLEPIVGAETHTFYSYRVAETVARYGPMSDNSVMGRLSSAARRNVELACDSTGWIELLDGVLPANYAAVLSRCELGRRHLGFDVDDKVVDDLLSRARQLIERNPAGYLDDSEDGSGGRYDIYTADIYLFTEPFATALGDAWERGARASIDLAAKVVGRRGAAIPWGRSTGALSTCLTVELGAMAIERSLTSEPARWAKLAALAFDECHGWFERGVITAHQHRSTYDYRGPERRLQMSLDCLGKLVYSALALQRAGRAGLIPAAAEVAATEAYPDHDSLVVFDPDRNAATWSHRSGANAFCLPIVGPTRSDYLPALRAPGLYEVPVDCDLVTGTPSIRVGRHQHAGGGLPDSIRKFPGGIELSYDGFPEVDGEHSKGRLLPGRREVTLTVAGRRIEVRERLQFAEEPDSVSIQIAETAGRPLSVRWDAGAEALATTIDTSGLKEYRSFWAELPVVHQLDLETATEVSFDYSITPTLRIASDSADHHYVTSLYDPLGDRVTIGQFFRHWFDDPVNGADRLAKFDVFHINWPEWFLGNDVDAARRFFTLLDDVGVPLVWTQHNLVPHLRDQDYSELYAAFAERADAVIHHSDWGRTQATNRYTYGDHTEHRVIPHGHWGSMVSDVAGIDRGAAERALGLDPCRIRIGIVGAPRTDKDTVGFMEGFARSSADDVQLLVLSLGPDEQAPDDPRISAHGYEYVDRSEYNRRLATIDVIALPFAPDGEMLTTGVFADAVGLGLPALVTPWPFLVEILGGAGIVYESPDDLAAVVDGLDTEALDAAAATSRELQQTYDFATIAEDTLTLLETLDLPSP